MIQEATEVSPSVSYAGMWIGVLIAIVIIVIAAVVQIQRGNKRRWGPPYTGGGGHPRPKGREGHQRPR